MLFEHEADRPSVQHHPRDLASVNAMKQTCVIVILAYFTLFQLNSHCKRRLCTFERLYVITVRNVFGNKNIGEMISLVRNAFRI